MPLPPTSRYAVLTRGVGLVTPLGTATALTATGALVGVMAESAHEQDAARAAAKQQQAAPARPVRRVVVKPVPRPVRTLVVRVAGRPPARVDPAPGPSRPRVTRRTTTVTTGGNQGPSRNKPPAPTPAPAATTSSGS